MSNTPQENKTITTQSTQPKVSTTDLPKPAATGGVSTQSVTPPVEAVQVAIAPVLSEDEALLNDASIIARPLAMPDTLKVVVKDPHYSFRWINYRGQGGSWFQRMRAIGWEPAAIEDVTSHHPEVHEDGGKLVIGDLMLMKMPREKYLGALKHNLERSDAVVSHRGAMAAAQQAANAQLRHDLGGVPASAINGKVGFFTPDKAGVETLFRD